MPEIEPTTRPRSLRVALLGIALIACAGVGTAAQAQPSSALELFPRTADPDDPLGIPEELPPPPAPRDTAGGPPAVQTGAVVTAIPGLREREHRLALTLGPASIVASESLLLENHSRWDAELMSSLRAPSHARVLGVERCPVVGDEVEPACVSASPREAGIYAAALALPPETYASPAARGGARPGAGAERPAPARPLELALHHGRWRVRAALGAGERARIVVRWEAPVTMHAGVVRATLAPRGSDPRAASLDLHWESPRLIGLAINERAENARGARELEPWDAIRVLAHLPRESAPEVRTTRGPCADAADQTCVEVRAWSGPRATPPLGDEIHVLIDASPSMRGPARGLVRDTLTTLIAQLPDEADVRVHAFGASAETLARGTPGELDLDAIIAASQRPRGSSSRWHAPLVSRRARELRRAEIFVIGDGGASRDEALRRVVATLRRARARVSAVVLGGDALAPGLAEVVSATHGRAARVVDDGPRSTRAERIDEALAPLFADRVRALGWVEVDGTRHELGPLLAGELQRVMFRGSQVRIDRRLRPEPLEGSSTSWAWVPGEVDARCGAPVSAAVHVPAGSAACAVALAPAVARRDDGIVAETLLGHLRTRLIPPARQCLRRDRAGRANYAVRATYTLELEDSEVRAFRVEGEIDDTLRTCLEETVHRLDLPRFNRRYAVRYPIHTERVEEEPRVILDEESESMLAGALRAQGVTPVERAPE